MNRGKKKSDVHVLRFRVVNQDTFNAIRSGKKRVETRAATEKYRSIREGDTIIFVCGKSRFEQKAAKVRLFKSVDSLARRYGVRAINSKAATAEDLRRFYYRFSGYKQKLKKFGLIAIEIKK